MARRKPASESQSTETILEAINQGNEELTSFVERTFQNQNSALLEIVQGLQRLTDQIGNSESSATDSHAADVERLSEAGESVVNELQTASLLHQLMNDSELADQLDRSSGEEEASAAEPGTTSSCDCCHTEDEPILELEHFEPIDVDALNEDEMRSALIDQERIVAKLASIVKQRQRRHPLFSAEQLQAIVDDFPVDLETLVRDSLKAIEQQASISELQLSLDRARVSRQISQLEETRQRLDARAKTLGVVIGEDGHLEDVGDAEKDGSKSRRWLGALGFGN